MLLESNIMTVQPIDSELIVRAKASDHQALTTIYEHYSPAIYRYIYYRVGDAELAEDLRAEVFLRMLEKINRYEDRGWPLSSWLYRIAHDRTIDALRYQSIRKYVPFETWTEKSDILESSVALRLDCEALHDAIERLTDDQRAVIQMRFLQDMSLSETARILGRTPGAVKALQCRGLHALARHLRHIISTEASVPSGAENPEDGR